MRSLTKVTDLNDDFSASRASQCSLTKATCHSSSATRVSRSACNRATRSVHIKAVHAADTTPAATAVITSITKETRGDNRRSRNLKPAIQLSPLSSTPAGWSATPGRRRSVNHQAGTALSYLILATLTPPISSSSSSLPSGRSTTSETGPARVLKTRFPPSPIPTSNRLAPPRKVTPPARPTT